MAHEVLALRRSSSHERVGGVQGPRGAGCRRRYRTGAGTCESSSARARMLGRSSCSRCCALCWAQGTISSLDTDYVQDKLPHWPLSGYCFYSWLAERGKKPDYLMYGFKFGSYHSIPEAAGQSARGVQSHLLTTSPSRAGHSDGRELMLRGSKQPAGKPHHRRGHPRMMQPTCWEKACGSATQRCGTSDIGANSCTATGAAKKGMICA